MDTHGSLDKDFMDTHGSLDKVDFVDTHGSLHDFVDTHLILELTYFSNRDL